MFLPLSPPSLSFLPSHHNLFDPLQAAFDAVKVKGKALVEEAQGSFKKELEEVGPQGVSSFLSSLPFSSCISSLNSTLPSLSPASVPHGNVLVGLVHPPCAAS